MLKKWFLFNMILNNSSVECDFITDIHTLDYDKKD